ncbi:unnamed protein product [Litomosoides sigmodontis]|uniref:40S ribosomal protein S7 n=1 Tax=Litomosoides sigmodontis TaxID=42156 RepID=A0A3P7JN20_LITSI|nr:unnamed protein product [Litomosoides sigmodontis]
MPEGSSKIVVPEGKVPDELEKQVSNAIADLENNSDMRAQLRELYIVGAKSWLVRELEKKFSGKHVVFIARRRILPKPKRGKNRKLQKQKRPRSRTLTAVHDAMLADLVYPAEVVGRRTRVKLDGKRIIKVHLDKTQQTNVEHKVDTFSAIYKYLTGKDIAFEFPEPLF